jgi:regulator of protease activity HflC (stomatin/prohibitin superfamily)
MDETDSEEVSAMRQEPDDEYESMDTLGSSGFSFIILFLAIVFYISNVIIAGIAIWIPTLILFIIVFLLGIIKVNSPYEKTVVLRLGRFSRISEQGLYYIYPIIEKGFRLDQRIRTSTFVAEQTLTKDNVPVDVDAVIFWAVEDVKKAVLNIQDYYGSIKKASMTALRDAIGRAILTDMISNRDALDNVLKTTIDKKVKDWGIQVDKVEIKEVRIPKSLQDAMSRQAQAEREKQARVILGDSEVQIAKKFEEAAKVYSENPAAMHLRGMNMMFESIKATDTVVIVPSSALDTMGFGGIVGTANIKGLIKKDKKDSD